MQESSIRQLRSSGMTVFRMSTCQGEGGGYVRRLTEDDAIFKENTWDELGARTGDVRAAHLRRVHD